MSIDVTIARPLTIAAHAPVRTNRDSPSMGSTSEETSLLCCCVCCVVVITYSFSFLWLLCASWLSRQLFISPFWSPVSAASSKVGWRRVRAAHPPPSLSIGSDGPRYRWGCRRCRRLGSLSLLLLLFSVLARQMLRSGPDDHHDRHRAPHRCQQPRLPHRVGTGEHGRKEVARDGVVHCVHHHDDQHAPVGVVEHPVKDDHSAHDQHYVRVVDLPNHHQWQVPAGYEYSEDQTGKERRSTGLQTWQGEAPPTRLLPCPTKPGDKEADKEDQQEARPAT